MAEFAGQMQKLRLALVEHAVERGEQILIAAADAVREDPEYGGSVPSWAEGFLQALAEEGFGIYESVVGPEGPCGAVGPAGKVGYHIHDPSSGAAIGPQL